ncbi:MAG TPA: electron transfer flavoprotein subunit alpha/FixB family protein [Longimicrobiales bacterium]|nr:electron transfer flavoprotein subunit alpha/FixB family protein [Longimicrobiales bacterium]
MATVLAIAEQRDGSLRRVAHETVTAARTLAESVGGETHALLLGGAGVESLAPELGRFGADTVHVGTADVLADYQPDAWASAVASFVKEHGFDTVLFAATSTGRDLAPRVAARLDVPLASDAVELETEDRALRITRPVYAGKAMATVVVDAEPRLVSLRPNVFTPIERAGAATVSSFQPVTGESRVRLRERQQATGGQLDVGEATIVISGGRGMQGPERWQILEELRDAFGGRAALGASRAVVDAGWRPHAEQVGQTGKTVAPALYIAVGISGAIQHLAGMRTAGTIVAINKDPDAPIFKVADYGIVGDAFEVVPKLAEAIRAHVT